MSASTFERFEWLRRILAGGVVADLEPAPGSVHPMAERLADDGDYQHLEANFKGWMATAPAIVRDALDEHDPWMVGAIVMALEWVADNSDFVFDRMIPRDLERGLEP